MRHVYDRIDTIDQASLHCSLTAIDTFVTSTSDSDYGYYSIVTFSTSDASGATAEGQAAISCTVSPDGTVGDVYAVSLMG